jgi:hypothetical protein
MMETVFMFLLGLLLRIGLPVVVTGLIFFVLRRLDERWRKEALAIPVMSTSQRPCWELKGCPEEKRSNCPASSQKNTPCWQVFRTKNGLLREECLECEVFYLAPIPVLS